MECGWGLEVVINLSKNDGLYLRSLILQLLRAYHAMHWPCVRGLAVYAGVRLSATKTDISALYEPPRLEEDFAFFYISNNWLYVSKQL